MDRRSLVCPTENCSPARPDRRHPDRVSARPGVLGVAGLWVALVLGLGFSGPAAAQDNAAKAITGKDTPVAKYDGKTLTAGDVAEMIKNTGFTGEVGWNSLAQFGNDRLDLFLQRQIADQSLARQAAEDKEWTKPASIEKDLQQLRDKLVMQQLYRVAVADQSTTPSDEDLRKYYDDHKENFRVAFSFTMRHLFLSTYEDYTVKEGDTLETIAQNVAGDKAEASKILLKSTKRPPGQKEEEGKDANSEKPGEEKPVDIHVDLKPGEELLVPMSAAKTEAVKKEIDSYYKQLEGGADFKELAAEHSQAASGGDEVTINPTKERPMLQEIVDAVKSTNVGSFSKPFQTKHGWQIVEVVKRTDESVRPFDEVKKNLITQVEREKQKSMADAFIQKAFDQTGILTINMDAFKADAKDDAVVATAGPYRYTRQDMLIDFPKKVNPDLTKPEVEKMLRSVNQIQRQVLLAEAEKMKLADRPDVAKVLAQAEIGMIAQNYLRELVDRKSKNVSDADLKDFYEKNQETFKEPRKLDLYAIALPIATGGKTAEESGKAREEAEAKLNAWKSEIKNLAGFQKIAKENSVVKPEESGHLGEVTTSYLNGLNGALESMKTGEVTGPVAAQDKVYLLWADSETPAAIPPFDKVKESVSQAYRSKMQRGWEDEVRKGVDEKVGYKFLLPLPAKTEKPAKP